MIDDNCLRELQKITDGKGIEWTGKLTFLNQQKVIVEKIDAIKHKLPKKLIHLAIAPTKSNDRFEFFIEKCIEIGISEITPLLCFHSERKTIKLERLKKIMISACKQSKNFHFPKLNDLTPFNNIVNSKYNHKLIAHCADNQKWR